MAHFTVDFMIKYCPNCQQPFSCDELNSDYNHKCNSDTTVLNNEDILIKGDYISETTNSNVVKQSVNFQGVNKVWGTRAGHEGMRVSEYTARGNRKPLYRQRQYYQNVKTGEGI